MFEQDVKDVKDKQIGDLYEGNQFCGITLQKVSKCKDGGLKGGGGGKGR